MVAGFLRSMYSSNSKRKLSVSYGLVLQIDTVSLDQGSYRACPDSRNKDIDLPLNRGSVKEFEAFLICHRDFKQKGENCCEKH